MIIYRELKIELGHSDKTICFGQANTDKELRGVYGLRYSTYSARGYIDPTKYPDGLENDDYDLSGKCHHFIAKLDDKIIGYIRVIVDDPLPTEKYFTFAEPEALKPITRNQRSELGRFIIIPPNKDGGEYLPRGLVMLFILDTLSSFGLNHGLLGGYAFVKKSLHDKMKRLHMPIGEIPTYAQRYPSDGALFNYFNQPDDPVIPIYFLTKDFFDYSEKQIRNSMMFRRDGEHSFALRANLYNGFLKTLKII